ncbi:hypothetical protein LRAMOSA09935 [Lichtheimia ramosa]|uniref:Uncharacterized protein n=1 Tax=Lichtheimia ramosa TaxID=688394 RepID=A0A077WNC4_9FUNG|nr:hypothetical protein LRAMOSA09935 [Lichtheimia ramosa]
MKFSAIAIICAIASAPGVTAQGEQQENDPKCAEKYTEQKCKDAVCEPYYYVDESDNLKKFNYCGYYMPGDRSILSKDPGQHGRGAQ